MHISRIRTKVKEAMVVACDNMLTFTDEPSLKINSEYLFTVNVAKAISKLNNYHADPYKIYLEWSTKKFARDCLRPFVFGNPLKRGSSILRRGIPHISRNGRIDVVVYIDESGNYYFGSQPLCAIELKAFNPPRKVVKDDLTRNLEYFRISGNTGGSVLQFTLFAAFHSFSKTFDTLQACKNENKIKN